MRNWLIHWQNIKRNHLKSILYMYSALLPMAIMLVVWFFMGSYPFGNKSLMAVDFGQQYISFFGLLKNAVLSGDLTSPNQTLWVSSFSNDLV